VVTSYQHLLHTLSAEWATLSQVLGQLTAADWAAPTRLEPVDAQAPHWTVAELTGHLTFGANMVGTLIENRRDGDTLDRVSFFTMPRATVAPLVYGLARDSARDQPPERLLGELRGTFERVGALAEAADPDLVGEAGLGAMPLREFVPTRIVEAVVHGIDLAQALGRPRFGTPDGITSTAAILDGLLARHGIEARPADLINNAEWVETGSGRRPHPDPRLPLIT
jgi:uncharacterized protein (TIGR03083 family)